MFMISDARGGTPRTSPVAVRVKSPASVTPVPWLGASELTCVLLSRWGRRPPLRSPDHEPMLGDLAPGEGDDGSMDVAAVVFGAGVDGEGASDARLAPRFVDVAVQRDHRLHLLDQLPHGLGADRDRVGLPADVAQREVGVDLVRGVETRVVGRDVEVED